MGSPPLLTTLLRIVLFVTPSLFRLTLHASLLLWLYSNSATILPTLLPSHLSARFKVEMTHQNPWTSELPPACDSIVDLIPLPGSQDSEPRSYSGSASSRSSPRDSQ